MREHAELLSSVRDDISEYKVSEIQTVDFFPRAWITKSAIVQASGSMSPRVQLLRERAAIHGSIAHVRLHCSSRVILHPTCCSI